MRTSAPLNKIFMKNPYINIDNRRIGLDYPPYIIAEMSANHNGSLSRALQIIEMAKHSGADAIKLQTYTPDTITLNCNFTDFQIKGGLWDGQTLYQLYQKAHTPYQWHKPLFDKARKIGISIFSSPFDKTAVDLLEDLNAPAYKIASFEAIDLPLIRYVAQTGKPMIISTGMANEEEIKQAVDTARENGCKKLILLHCISAYPTPATQCNLRTIVDLSSRFNVISGLSDHSLKNTVALTAIALGACVIEKHVTLNKNDKGPDSSFSLTPNELKNLCQETQIAWQSLGQITYQLKEAEMANLQFRRSLYVTNKIKKGELFSSENIRSIRPGFGIKPKFLDMILGKKSTQDIEMGQALNWEMVEENMTLTDKKPK